MNVFMKGDDDGDGILTMQEAKHYCKQALEQRYPGKDFDETKFNKGFYSIDADNGGSIDFRELNERMI